MGLGIALVDFRGQILDRADDPKNFLHRALPPADDESESLLSKIDWYGDTYFNHIQMKRFLAEWQKLEHLAQTPEELTLVAAVRDLAVRCQKDEGLVVLRFIGD